MSASPLASVAVTSSEPGSKTTRLTELGFVSTRAISCERSVAVVVCAGVLRRDAESS